MTHAPTPNAAARPAAAAGDEGRFRRMVLTGRADSLPLMPITMMFAADRLGRNYHDYVTDYRVLAEAQALTAEQFDIDHVSVISDPVREAADCGARVQFFEDQPPAPDDACPLLDEPSKLLTQKLPDPLGGGRMHDRVLGVELLRRKVGRAKTVEGWIEGPIAQACDLRGMPNVMMDFYENPDFLRDLFAFIVEMETSFAAAQVAAGADLIGIGDAAASLIGPALYEEFVQPFEQQLVNRVRGLGAMVRLHICGNTRPLLSGIGRLGCQLVDLDSMAPVDEARAAVGPATALVGNLDPVLGLRDGTPESIARALEASHRAAGKRYVVGAGCEIPRDTPPENLHALREYARAH